MKAAAYLWLVAPAAATAAAESVKAPAPVELAGAWSGHAEHEGETTPFALELEPQADGKMLLKVTVPSAHFTRVPLGSVPVKQDGRRVTLGPFTFDYDADAKTLAGVVPSAFAPVYRLPLLLRRVDRFEPHARPFPCLVALLLYIPNGGLI